MVVSVADSLVRFVFERAAVQGALVGLDVAYRDSVARRPYPPRLARLLGETMGAMCLLANGLKSRGSLVLQLQGAGPVQLLVVECDASLSIRATAKWRGDIGDDATLAELAGDPRASRMALTLDPRDGGPLYQGVVALEGTSVAALFEHYLAASEQITSRLWLEAAQGSVRGLLLQRMPGHLAAGTEAVWERAVAAVDAAASRFAESDAHALLAALFRDDDVRAFCARTPRSGCSCSRERAASVLRTLGSTEVESILAERGAVAVDCEFCNRRHEFSAEEARALFAAPRSVAVH